MALTEMNPTKWSRTAVVASLAFALLLIPILLWTVVGYTYSEGDRVGFVERLSQEGTLCHTNEGTLLMATTPGSPGNTWAFSVRDRRVADEVSALKGQKVALHYHQDKGGLSTCFRRTAYVVTDVRKID